MTEICKSCGERFDTKRGKGRKSIWHHLGKGCGKFIKPRRPNKK